jgi:hypothetical protein
MRFLRAVPTLILGLGLAVGACGQDPTSGGGDGGPPNCQGINYVFEDKDGGDPCDICIRDQCCPQVAACRENHCVECVSGGGGPDCPPQADAVINCAAEHCGVTCHIYPPDGGSSTDGGAGGTGGK